MSGLNLSAISHKEARKETWAFVKGWWIKSISALLAIPAFMHEQFGYEWWQVAIVDLVIICIILTIYYRYSFIVACREERRRLNADSIYGAAFKGLNVAFSKVHAAQKDPGQDFENIYTALTCMCEELRKIFDTKTGKECSICIKVIAGEPQEEITVSTAVETLCRDSRSSARKKRKAVDNSRTDHGIFSNTSFRSFIDRSSERDGSYYLCNNLPAEQGYISTSFDVHGDPEPMDDMKKRTNNWPLPYHAEIVVPVCPYDYHKENSHRLLYGYLSVDSPEGNVFNSTFDVEILRGVADGIFDMLHIFIEHRNNGTIIAY